MSSSIRTTVINCLVIVGIVLVVFVYSVMRTPTLTLEQLREKGTFILPEARELPTFNLVCHDGQAFTNSDLEGHWSLVYFGFTSCPDICPTTMAVLAQTQALVDESGNENLQRDFQVILFSVDPDHDTPEILAPYVAAFSVSFTGVTGTVPAISEVAKQVSVGFQKVPNTNSSEAGAYLVDHTSQIVLINPQGKYHGFIRAPHEANSLFQIYQTIHTTY